MVKHIDGAEACMTEYIYGDVLFLINFSMDFLALYISGKICKTKMKAWRISLGAALGALYGVVSLLIDVNYVFSFIIEAAVAAWVCAVGLWCGGIPSLLISTAAFYASSLTLGGAMTFIYSRLGRYKTYFESGGSILSALDDVPIWVFAVCAALSFIISRAISLLEKRRGAIISCAARITLNGRERGLMCLVDSGALAVEPISGTPVIFVSKKYADMVTLGDGGAMMRGIYAIPISSIGGEGIAFAIRPDKCEIEIRGQFEERRALIALGSDELYGGFDAILPYSLL